jgi:hypothetical protein
MTDKIGDVAATVDPESFFQDEDVSSTSENGTRNTSEQQPRLPVSNVPTEPPTEEAWDGTKWAFKAAGKQWEPKDREELMKWASFGVNYDTKARALNQQKAELLAMKEELAAAKEVQGGLTPPAEEDTSSLFSDPNEAINKKIADMEKRLEYADSRALKQESIEMDTALTEGLKTLNDEVSMTPEESDELLLELQGRIDSLPDTAIDAPEKIQRIIRNLYFELHPEAIDEIVEKRATAKAEQVKKSIGAKIVTEGSTPSAPTGKPAPTDFLDAQSKLLDAWDALPK